MHRRLAPLRLTNAHVLAETGLNDHDLSISDGRISSGPFPAVDLTGYWVMPGIIDLHGDAFEHHIAPRPSAPLPLSMALPGVDRDAAGNGITTAWLAQSWSWEGGMRGPDFAETVAEALALYRPHAMTDLRLQLRFETHEHDSDDRLLAAIDRWGIDYVVFNNHLDEALMMWDSRPHDLLLWARRAGRSAEQMMAVIVAAKARTQQVPRRLCRLAEAFDARGVTYGSHDDPDGETRETFAMIGARICEFPFSQQAASVARALGNPVLMGAPNVVRGGSQAGNIAASALIGAGRCDALVSDYHYPAMAAAAFRLVDDGLRSLPQAWAMISAVPARIMNLTDRGVIAPRKRADLCIVNKATRQVEATITAGRMAYLTAGAAERFLAAPQRVTLAAE